MLCADAVGHNLLEKELCIGTRNYRRKVSGERIVVRRRSPPSGFRPTEDAGIPPGAGVTFDCLMIGSSIGSSAFSNPKHVITVPFEYKVPLAHFRVGSTINLPKTFRSRSICCALGMSSKGMIACTT